MSCDLESDVEQDLCRWAEDNGVLCFKIKIEAVRGAPDRLLILPGGDHVYVELKRPGGGKVSPQQRIVHKRLRDQGCLVLVTDNLEDIIDAIEVVTMKTTWSIVDASDFIGNIMRCQEGYLGLVLEVATDKDGRIYRGIHLSTVRAGEKWESRDPNILGRLEDLPAAFEYYDERQAC